MNKRQRIRVSELAVLLGISGMHAWRLTHVLLRPRSASGAATVDLGAALRLKASRESDPPNKRGRGGRPTYVERMKAQIDQNRTSLVSTGESAEGSRAPVSRATRGVKKTAGGGALLSAEPKPAVSRRRSLAALREYDPRLIPVGR